jgi:hypothetical protein
LLLGSTPPGTSCACGMRRGRPDTVVPPVTGSAARLARSQPSSAGVRHWLLDTGRGAAADGVEVPAGGW